MSYISKIFLAPNVIPKKHHFALIEEAPNKIPPHTF